MPEYLSGARARLLSLTATLSTVLVMCVVAGFLVGMNAEDALPRRTSAGVSTAVPLRVPAATVTMTARPSPGAVPSTPEPTLPPAAQRDRELAALAAVPVPTAGTAPVLLPSTSPTLGAELASDTGVPEVSGSTDAGATGTSDQAADFVLSSFNVLGSSHTRNGARGRQPGVVRIRGAAQLLARHDVDVVGFQELQQDQARALRTATNGSYALYPGPGKGKDSENSIGWRTSEFELVSSSTVAIPYFNGHRRSMPVVLLRHKASGVQSWFANFHNPAETSKYHHQQKWRNQATVIEANLANRLKAAGVPLFITGDMNERAPYFCRLTGSTSMVAARGGTNGSGGCAAGKPRAVDWIFGERGVSFSGYGEDRSDLVDRTTDHPVITSHVRVAAATFPRSLSVSP